MRLLGVSFLALLLIALAALAVDRRAEIVAALAPTPDRDVETHIFNAAAPLAASAEPETLEVSFAMEDGLEQISLIGFPSYGKVRFPLPLSAEAVAGTLALDVSADVELSGSGVLKVSLNGTRRAAIVLKEGRQTHQIRIELTSQDLAQTSVSVTLSADGITEKPPCTREWAGASVVRIDPTSHVKLSLSTPLSGLRDKLAAAGAHPRLVWSDEPSGTKRAQLLLFARGRAAAGKPVQLVDAAQHIEQAISLTSDELETGLGTLWETPLNQVAAWPAPLAGSRATRAQHFEYEAQWQTKFDLRELPKRETPTHLQVDLRIDGASAELLLTVELNGALVHSELVTTQTGNIQAQVALPAGPLKLRNDITFRLRSAEERSGECARGTPKVAQLTSQTQLLRQAISGRHDMQPTTLLEGDFALSVSDSITALQANAGLDLLARAAPVGSVTLTAKHTIGIPQLQLVPATELTTEATPAGTWVILPNNDSTETADFAIYQPSDPALAAHLKREMPRVALVVTTSKGTGG